MKLCRSTQLLILWVVFTKKVLQSMNSKPDMTRNNMMKWSDPKVGSVKII
ncbi:hypothetical protein RchiOBHm_Chr3g0483431 [Rosa chinensis]|uniref:Uncharacterized protein n=1 Tax=Rosa chinensis TaxID=74649 RepID=A0A2P6REG8_ROSCH|nr:hypothetical protein RchiOBHm_Chr3g0483431 [Rosa chinensis]